MCALDILTMLSSQCTKNQVSAASDQVCHPGQINIDAMTHWERVNRTNALLWPMLVRTPSLAYTIELNTRLGGTNVQISIRVWRPQQGGQYHMKIPFWHRVMIHLSCQSETMKQESKVWITCWVILPMMQNRFYGSPVGNDCIWLVIIVKQIHEIFAEMFGSDVQKKLFLPTASWTVGRHTQGSTLRFVRLSNPTYLSFGQVELTAWLPSFKYQYTRKKFLYQPRKWFFNQPARKLSVDPWIHCTYSRPHAWYWVDVLGPRVQKWWCMDRQLLVRECCKEVDRQTPPPTCKRASAWTLWDPGRYTGTRVMSIQSQYLRTSIANLVSW